MANYLNQYQSLLIRAVATFDGLIALYTPESQEGNSYATGCAKEAANKRQAILEDIALPRRAISRTDTSPFSASMLHYLDNHWADYALYPPGNGTGIGYPNYNPEKHQEIERLHAELQAVMSAVGDIDNALSQKQQ